MTTQTIPQITEETKLQKVRGEIRGLTERINARRIAITTPLSKEAELVHSEAYEIIRDVLPANLPKRPIRQGHIGIEGGFYRENGEELPGIIIDKTLASMIHMNPGFLIFKEENEKKSPNPRDFLRSVIIHEYGHIFDDMKTDYSIIITTGLMRNLVESEAFAFWFADELTGLKTMYRETINSFLDPVNTDKMKHLHSRLHETSTERGIDYVLRNHRMLMCKYRMNLD